MASRDVRSCASVVPADGLDNAVPLVVGCRSFKACGQSVGLELVEAQVNEYVGLNVMYGTPSESL